MIKNLDVIKLAGTKEEGYTQQAELELDFNKEGPICECGNTMTVPGCTDIYAYTDEDGEDMEWPVATCSCSNKYALIM